MTTVVHVSSNLHTVYCGRGTDPKTGVLGQWGNLFSHLPGTTATYRTKSKWGAVRQHEKWVRSKPELVARIKRELKDQVLGCWCRDNICHAVTLARIADE